jgi:hypothetical protein
VGGAIIDEPMSSRLEQGGLVAKRRALAACLAFGLSGASTGCVTEAIANAGINATYQAARSTNTIQDFEIGRSVVEANIGQIEGFHSISPGNVKGLLLLTKGWTAIGLAFLEDEYEEAYQSGNEQLTEYQLRRERAAFARARYFGVEALGHYADGFDAARRNAETMQRWVERSFDSEDEAPILLWTGVAWMAHAATGARDDPAAVGELYVGVELVRRSVALDPSLEFAMGETLLGVYHARSALAELGESKVHFDRALSLNHGKFLTTKLLLAQRYYCLRGDRAMYERTLNDVLADPDPLPEARLQNVVAKRLARRYLGNKVWQEDCAFSK